MMGLVEFIFVAVILGLIVYFVNTYLPIPAPIKTIIMVVAVLVVLLILIRAVGFDVPIPRYR